MGRGSALNDVVNHPLDTSRVGVFSKLACFPIAVREVLEEVEDSR